MSAPVPQPTSDVFKATSPSRNELMYAEVCEDEFRMDKDDDEIYKVDDLDIGRSVVQTASKRKANTLEDDLRQ